MRDKLLALSCLSVLACAQDSPNFPVYQDIGFRLSGKLKGVLERAGDCWQIDNDSSKIVLVLPKGSSVSGDNLRLPSGNSRQMFKPGDLVAARGGYVTIDGHGPDEFRRSSCRGEGFIVNTMEK